MERETGRKYWSGLRLNTQPANTTAESRIIAHAATEATFEIPAGFAASGPDCVI